MRPSIGIIGAGKIGTAVATLLHRAGHPVAGVVCRSMDRARNSVKIIGGGTPSDCVTQGVIGAQLIFITVPDDAIASVASEVGRFIRQQTGKIQVQCLIHTSGVHDADILARPGTRHLGRLSMHPIQSVPDRSGGADRLEGAFWGLEGSTETVDMGRDLVFRMNGHPLSVGKGKKSLYHAAAVVSSNYVVALLDAGTRLMKASGVAADEAKEAVAVLASGAVSNVRQTKHIPQALTGPIERGDVDTISTHWEALATSSTPLSTEAVDETVMRQMYRWLALYTVDLARKKHRCFLHGKHGDRLRKSLKAIERTLRSSK